MRPEPSLFVVVLTLATSAIAQTTISATAPAAPDSLFELRLRSGVAHHQGEQQDSGPGLSYGGLTPNNVSFAGWVWPLLDGKLGLAAAIDREAFGLYEGSTLVARMTLLRAQVGVAGRFRAGIFRAEPMLLYAFDEVPALASSLSTTAQPRARHSALLAVRGALDLGRVSAEARLDVPIQLPVGGASAGIRDLSDNASVSLGARVDLFRTGKLVWGAGLEGTYSGDRISIGELTASQRVIRGTALLSVQWKEEPPVAAPKVGTLKLAVLSADDGTPLPAARLVLQAAGGAVPVTLDTGGTGTATQLEPGPVVASATLDGYLPAEERGTVEAGAELRLVLKLAKEAPKTGGLSFFLTDKLTGAPVAKAAITVGGRSVTTDDQGQAAVDDLPVGPTSVSVVADTFQPAQEAATVVGGLSSRVALQLLSAKKRTPATITGAVRSARGGQPVPASLAIPEANLKMRANANGQFTFKVTGGGTYTVNISSQGYLSQTKSVTVQDGEQVILNVDLSPR